MSLDASLGLGSAQWSPQQMLPAAAGAPANDQAMQLLAAIVIGQAMMQLASTYAMWQAFAGMDPESMLGMMNAGGGGLRPYQFGARDPKAVHRGIQQQRRARQSGTSDGGAAPNIQGNRGSANRMLQAALAQKGDRYVFGAETNLNDPNPNTFDCSELVQWAVHQAGGTIPDGSQNQRAYCRQHGRAISVEQAIHTPGALLFNGHHVAISLGDGRTIEAMGSAYGVRIGHATPGRFEDGGLVPGLSYA